MRLALDAENIEARPVWKPMHLQPVFNPQITSRKGACLRATHRQAKAQNWENYKTRAVGGSVAEDLFNRGLCLPSGTAMTEDDLNRVIDTIMHCRKKAQK